MASEHGEDKELLKLDLPVPKLEGTPPPIQVPNLEKWKPGEKRPGFLVPKGTVLLSKGMPVSSSDEFPFIGDLKMTNDGVKEGGDGFYVELGPGRQWVQIDLGAPAQIHAIVFWLCHAGPRAYHDVVVQVSNDPGFETGVVTLFNNDYDNSSGFGVGKDPAYLENYQGRLIDAKGTAGRYVRVNTNGNTSNESNHFTEIEVYGTTP